CPSRSPPSAAKGLQPKSAKVTIGSSAPTAEKCAIPSTHATTSPTASLAKKISTTSTCSSPWAMPSTPPSPSSSAASINTKPSKQKRKRHLRPARKATLHYASPIPTIHNGYGDSPNPVAPPSSKMLNNLGNQR